MSGFDDTNETTKVVSANYTVLETDFNVFVGPLPAQIPGLFDGLSVRGPLAVPPSSPDFTGFHTVATVPVRQRPLGIGLITKASDPVWADAVYSHLETLTPLLWIL